jgi:hypothetical protein
MEIETMLHQLFGGSYPDTPEKSDLTLPSETPIPSDAAEIIPVNVPGNQTTHKGYALQRGKLHLATALQDHAILLLTSDDTFVHIGTDKRVVMKKDGQKVRNGMIEFDNSSRHIEKDYPAILVFNNAHESQVITPLATIKEVIIYQPQIAGDPTRRSSNSTDEESNMSTMLLRQFLK